MKKIIPAFLFVVCFAAGFHTYAQTALALPEAILQIERPASVDTLLLKKMISRQAGPDMGWRVLIFSQSGNNSKDAAIQAKNEFDMFYPDYPSYISFEEPSFKVKAGNFISRTQAEFFLREIKPFYPYGFIVRDFLSAADYLNLNSSR